MNTTTLSVIWTVLSLVGLTGAFVMPFIAWEEWRLRLRELQNTPEYSPSEHLLAEHFAKVSFRMFVVHCLFIPTNGFFALAGLTAVLIPAVAEPSAQTRALLIPLFLVCSELLVFIIHLFVVIVTLSMRSTRHEWNALYIWEQGIINRESRNEPRVSRSEVREIAREERSEAREIAREDREEERDIERGR